MLTQYVAIFLLKSCTGLPECTCLTHPCIDANTGNHTNIPCNPAGGDIHTCFEEPTTDENGNEICQKRCSCAPGFDHGVENKLDVCFGMYWVILSCLIQLVYCKM